MDDAQHTVFGCRKWAEPRNEYERSTGRKLSPVNITEDLVSPLHGQTVINTLRKTLKLKEETDRKRT